MMKNLAVFLFAFLPLFLFSQQNKILVFDVETSLIDTLDTPTFDSAVVKEETPYFVGNVNPYINFLDQNIPTENLYPNSSFTKKKRASLDYNVYEYPIRTTVKIYRQHNDSLKHLCSGILISKKHVITACHCVAAMGNDSIQNSELFVAPAYDNGNFSPFNGDWVSKIYFFENWNFNKDIALLELNNPIGENTGWVSIGTYGVLSMGSSDHAVYSRINPIVFYSFKEIIKNDYTVQISDNQMDENVNIYPNPANDFININIKEPVENVKILIYNSLGKLLIENYEDNPEFRVGISEIPYGFYLLKLEYNNRNVIKKFIKN